MKKEQPIDLSCSFCGKSQREVRKLIAGPSVICDECIRHCNNILAEPEDLAGVTPAHEALRCSWCGKAFREGRKLLAGTTGYICDECIGLCNDILAEELGRED